MAQLSKPAIPWKMYRHFAVATLAVTACLAIFADGGNSLSTSAADLRSEQRAEPARSRPSPVATPRYGAADFRAPRGYSTRADVATSSASGPRSSGRSAMFVNSSEIPSSLSENAGFTREYLDSLSDEELDELLRQLQAAGIENPATRQQALLVLETASRRRSGRPTGRE
jgi:hypothetical protein